MVTQTTPNTASPAVDVVDTILATYPALLSYDQAIRSPSSRVRPG